MTILTSIILIAAIVIIALFIAYNMQRGKKAMSEFKVDFDNNPEIQAQVDMFKELYNKDLRPVVGKKAPKKVTEVEVIKPEVVKEEKPAKSEFPIDKPKRKRKYYPKKK